MISISLLLFIIGVIMMMIGQIRSQTTPKCDQGTKVVISDERNNKRDKSSELFNRSLFYSEITL